MPGPNSKTSAVVMAYWPSTRQHLDNIDYSTMQVGVVQHFVRHTIRVKDSTNKMNFEHHLLAHIKWKELHRNFDWFGVVATMCETVSEHCYCNFLRIARRCAHVTLLVNFRDTTDEVFIACPIPFKYCK